MRVYWLEDDDYNVARGIGTKVVGEVVGYADGKAVCVVKGYISEFGFKKSPRAGEFTTQALSRIREYNEG